MLWEVIKVSFHTKKLYLLFPHRIKSKHEIELDQSASTTIGCSISLPLQQLLSHINIQYCPHALSHYHAIYRALLVTYCLLPCLLIAMLTGYHRRQLQPFLLDNHLLISSNIPFQIIWTFFYWMLRFTYEQKYGKTIDYTTHCK